MNPPIVGLDRTSRSVISALTSLAVAFTMIRFGIARTTGTHVVQPDEESSASRMRVAA